MYGFPNCKKWIDEEVPKLNSGRLDADLTPSEQLDNLLHRWISGQPMRYDRAFKDLMPPEDEVWEMKTADLRIFGWIYRPRVYRGLWRLR